MKDKSCWLAGPCGCLYEPGLCWKCFLCRLRALVLDVLYKMATGHRAPDSKRGCPYRQNPPPKTGGLVFYVDGKRVPDNIPEVEFTKAEGAEPEEGCSAEKMCAVTQEISFAMAAAGISVAEFEERIRKFFSDILDGARTVAGRIARRGIRARDGRRKRPQRTVPQPPGGNTWTRQARKTRHLARGEIE